MERMLNWLNQAFWGNTLADYCWAFGIILLGFALRKAISVGISRLIFRLVKKESEQVPWAEFLRLLRPPFEFIFILIILFLATETLDIPQEWGWVPASQFGARMILQRLFFTVVLGAITWLGIRFIKFIGLVFKEKAHKTDTKLDDQLVPFFRDLVILFFVITMVFITLGRIFDVDVLTLLTSLGIGGLAIALAARETLENLFASFAIMLDRPFTVGDAINLGGMEGTIQDIGFRSTRMRTFDGSLITVPNRLLTSQSLENLTERRLRRARYVLRLANQTPVEQLKAVVKAIQELIDEHPETRQEPGVVRFDAFGESTLDILVIFYVETASPQEFNRVKEDVNFKIIEIVESEGASLAIPGRELYIRNKSSLKSTE